MRRHLVIPLAASLLATFVPLTPAAAAVPKCFGRTATIVGTDDDDEIQGTARSDVIYTGGGIDEVRAGRGDDLVCGGAKLDHLFGEGGDDKLGGGPDYADDWLFGGAGKDRLQPGCGGPEGDLLEGGAGADRLIGSDCGNATMVPGAGDDFVRATGGEIRFPAASGPIDVDLAERVATGEGRDRIQIVQPPRNSPKRVVTVVGTDFDDRMMGSELADSFQGGGGDDVIEGRRGADWLDGWTGDHDLLSGGPGQDFFQVYDGTEARGGGGDDVVVCEPRYEHESAQFFGGPGDDWVALLGLPSEGVVDLGSGTATCSFTYESGPPSTTVMELALDDVENVDAGRGKVEVTGSEERNVLLGGPGSDVLRGAGGDDEIDGVNGRDELRGGDGADVLLGGTFDDVLFGDAGDDVLDGEEGSDSVDGGDGRDRCTGETQRACEET